MPFIKGITDSISGSSSKPAINVQIPPINPVDVKRFELAFNGANPVLGILDSALFVYGASFSPIDHTYGRGQGHDDPLAGRSVL